MPIIRETRALIVFFILAFTLSWSGWIALQVMLANDRQSALVPWLFYSGVVVGPAALVAARVDGRDKLKCVIADILRVNTGAKGWALVLMVPVIWIVVSALVFTIYNHTGLGRVDLPAFWAIMTRPAGLQHLSYPVGEEIGWRGFLLPMLIRRRSALSSALIVGAIWAGWHVPFYWTKLLQDPAWFLNFSADVMCLSVIFAGIYLITRSVLATISLHWLINAIQDAAGPLFPDLPPLGGGSDAYALIMTFVIFVIAAIFALFLASYSSRKSTTRPNHESVQAKIVANL